MNDESADLLQTVLWTFEVIRTNKRSTVRRIAETYAEAQQLVATIPLADGSARPRIEACLKRWAPYREREDLAGTGWMLSAIQERVAERDLADWAAMKVLIDQAVTMLQKPTRALH